MCGIFGLISYENETPSARRVDHIKQLIMDLLLASESRGRDASGIFVVNERASFLYKNNIKGSEIPKMRKFKFVLNHINPMYKLKSVIGHTRSQTKGSPIFNINNHPIIINNIIGVHNGVISNDDPLFDKYKQRIERKGQVDSEIIFQLIEFYINKGLSSIEAVEKTVKKLYGSYACAFVDINDSNYVTIFKGQSYATAVVRDYRQIKTALFASTSYILDKATENNSYFDERFISKEIDLKKDMGLQVSAITGSIVQFDIDSNPSYYGLPYTGQSPNSDYDINWPYHETYNKYRSGAQNLGSLDMED